MDRSLLISRPTLDSTSDDDLERLTGSITRFNESKLLKSCEPGASKLFDWKPAAPKDRPRAQRPCRLFVMDTATGEKTPITLSLTQTVKSVKYRVVGHKPHLDLNSLRVSWRGNILDDKKTLLGLGIPAGECLHISMGGGQPGGAAKGQCMEVSVCCADDGTKRLPPKTRLQVRSSDLVLMVKLKIQERLGIPAGQQRLTSCGRSLANESRLWECGVKDEGLISLVIIGDQPLLPRLDGDGRRIPQLMSPKNQPRPSTSGPTCASVRLNFVVNELWPPGNKHYTCVPLGCTIKDIKEEIFRLNPELRPKRQMLLHRGRTLEDHLTPMFYNLEDGDRMDLFLVGGGPTKKLPAAPRPLREGTVEAPWPKPPPVPTKTGEWDLSPKAPAQPVVPAAKEEEEALEVGSALSASPGAESSAQESSADSANGSEEEEQKEEVKAVELKRLSVGAFGSFRPSRVQVESAIAEASEVDLMTMPILEDSAEAEEEEEEEQSAGHLLSVQESARLEEPSGQLLSVQEESTSSSGDSMTEPSLEKEEDTAAAARTLLNPASAPEDAAAAERTLLNPASAPEEAVQAAEAEEAVNGEEVLQAVEAEEAAPPPDVLKEETAEAEASPQLGLEHETSAEVGEAPQLGLEGEVTAQAPPLEMVEEVAAEAVASPLDDQELAAEAVQGEMVGKTTAQALPQDIVGEETAQEPSLDFEAAGEQTLKEPLQDLDAAGETPRKASETAPTQAAEAFEATPRDTAFFKDNPFRLDHFEEEE